MLLIILFLKQCKLFNFLKLKLVLLLVLLKPRLWQIQTAWQLYLILQQCHHIKA